MQPILKPGVKTSEFALTVMTVLASALGAFSGFLDPKWAAMATAISGGLYAISRGFAKQ